MTINFNIEDANLSAAKKHYVAPEIYVEEIVEEVEMLAGSPDNVKTPGSDGEGGGPIEELSKKNGSLWFGLDNYEVIDDSNTEY